MSDEPILAYLRRNPVTHQLELPDTEVFLQRGQFSRSPFLRMRPQKFRSEVHHPLAAKLANKTASSFNLKRKKAWARLLCRRLSFRERESFLDAARVLVNRGKYREEVQAGLVFLMFLARSEDLETIRTLSRNEAFTPYTLGALARLSPCIGNELSHLLPFLQGAVKADVVKLMLKKSTGQNIDDIIEHGFPKLELPIWKWPWRDEEFPQELTLWQGLADVWTGNTRLQKAVLSCPVAASRLAILLPDEEELKEAVLSLPRSLEHFFIDSAIEEDWSPYVLGALESDEPFSRRQGWTAAKRLNLDIDALASNHLTSNPHDYVAWEEVVPVVADPDIFRLLTIVPNSIGPAFELALHAEQWGAARALAACLRGIARFPGAYPSIVTEGLNHPVISVRLAAIGCASSWPDSTFQQRIQQIATSDPVFAVRSRASEVAAREPLRESICAKFQRVLSQLPETSSFLSYQLDTVHVLRQSEFDEGIIAFAQFAHSLTQAPSEIIEKDLDEGYCVISTDLSKRWLRWIEIL